MLMLVVPEEHVIDNHPTFRQRGHWHIRYDAFIVARSLRVYLEGVRRGQSLPPLGKAVDDLDVFVAREAEVDEPLAVEHPRRFLQQRNPAPVVLDQVVVGGEN